MADENVQRINAQLAALVQQQRDLDAERARLLVERREAEQAAVKQKWTQEAGPVGPRLVQVAMLSCYDLDAMIAQEFGIEVDIAAMERFDPGVYRYFDLTEEFYSEYRRKLVLAWIDGGQRPPLEEIMLELIERKRLSPEYVIFLEV